MIFARIVRNTSDFFPPGNPKQSDFVTKRRKYGQHGYYAPAVYPAFHKMALACFAKHMLVFTKFKYRYPKTMQTNLLIVGLVGETVHTSDLSHLSTGSWGQWPLFHRVASDQSPRSSPPPPPPVLTTEKWSENRKRVEIIWTATAEIYFWVRSTSTNQCCPLADCSTV